MDNVLASAARHQSESAVVIVVEKFAYMLLRLFKTRTTEAISMFEAVADDSHAAGSLKDRAETELARHFLAQMFRARNEDRWQKVAESVDRLIKLATANEQDAKNSLSRARDCCVILAALYQVNNLHARAMQCVRSNVKVGIAYLSDTDPDNDIMAWWALCDSLLTVGDENRAIAAVNMIRSGHFMAIEQSEERSEVADSDGLATNDKRVGARHHPPGSEGEIARPPPAEAQAYVSRTLSAVSKPSDHKQLRSAKADGENQASVRSTPQQATDEHNPSGAFPNSQESDKAQPSLDSEHPFFSCDGCCFELIANCAPMWRCSYCIANFCVNCHGLIKGGNMVGWNICDSLHHHVFVPGISAKYPKDYIKVNDEDVLVGDWVEELRQERGYPRLGS